jgi:hypothetical protein
MHTMDIFNLQMMMVLVIPVYRHTKIWNTLRSAAICLMHAIHKCTQSNFEDVDLRHTFLLQAY